MGIGYPGNDRNQHLVRRAFDLTVPASREWTEENTQRMEMAEYGGCRQFLEFITSELKPAIEEAYPVDVSRQSLVGHSFGGLFVLYVLFEQPDCFQNYVALSPSLWWADGSVLDRVDAFRDRLAESGSQRPRLFVGVGEYEQQPAPDDTKQRAELLSKRRMVSSAKELCRRLQSPEMNLAVEYAEFEGTNHGTMVLPGMARGVTFALRK